MVDLRKDQERVYTAWHADDKPHVPLALAVAKTFHDLELPFQGKVARLEYEDAMNLVAAALSRVVPIYTHAPDSETLVHAGASLANGRFRSGGSIFEARSGEALAPLVVRRDHLPAAVEAVKAVQLPFHFAPTVPERA